jgi:hypothetical protein
MLSPGEFAANSGLAALQGLLVALPRPAGSAGLRRFRSPGWALVLPVSLMIGTLGVLALRHGATALAILAAVATPVLVVLAAIALVRGRRLAWLAALPVLGAGVALHSWPGQVAATALTALGCVTLGAALVRLTPLPWLTAGIAAMCVVDIVLLATGLGEPAAHQMEIALTHSPLPEFDRAQLGSMSSDYPDLVLAAVLGATLAGHARQLTAALFVTVLASANGLLFIFSDILPGTLPLVVAAAAVYMLERRRGTARRSARRSRRPRALRAPVPQPAAVQPIVGDA